MGFRLSKMIKEIYLKKFKKFSDKNIDLKSNSLTLIVGGNNSGKSSILHAIAVWEFCKLILQTEKGLDSLTNNSHSQGYGLSADEFLPVAVPSLKHLWTNLKSQERDLKGGYNLRIGCKWDLKDKKDCYLEFGLSLVNDRLFIKTTESNIQKEDKIPTVAYLPPFAGILDRENMLSIAERRRLIGKGMSGSVLRNLILDMYVKNSKERRKLKENKSKINSSDLRRLRTNDSFELLQSTLREIFACELKVKPFNELYHTYIKIELYKGQFERNKFKKYPEYNERDIMVEGSGFLQWLSVYSLALDESIDVLLLDEPDSHLHSSLQFTLLNRLEQFSELKGKQILIATHSSEIIKNVEPPKILSINGQKINYLQNDQQKVGVLAGLGTEYSPILNKLQKHKKLLIVENDSDAKLLDILCHKLGFEWPKNLVVIFNSSGHKERKHLYLEFKREIEGLNTISLRDRDDENYNTVDDDLMDKTHNVEDNGIKCLKWKRRNIENYLLNPSAISRASGKSVEEIKQFIQDNYLLALPLNSTKSEDDALSQCDGKKIIDTGDKSISKEFHCSKFEIARNMEENEVCIDIRKVIKHIISMCDPDYEQRVEYWL